LDLKDIKELIALMRKNDLSVFKMEKEGFKITLKKGSDFQPIVATPGTPIPFSPAPAVTSAGSGETSAVTPAKEAEKLREIVSPMVGTFYSAASPDSPTYVSVGRK
jgi:acetyl-CoA carboxylase biotin carboxyl carrier protein